MKLDIDTFIAGLDSPNHSEQSRRDWIRLFYRDMENAVAAERIRWMGEESDRLDAEIAKSQSLIFRVGHENDSCRSI